ncbi:hypothetical protein B9Z65_3125 [Elsinoe australis]|uniref:Alpha-L-rhamnosidase C-terminal domain-containing protein n=1 Tax=Elsinoe australis TaxID=40998 RepID=A0A2P7ZUH8_9PEZI|nr:hypothetical protein B9Z65_3125 [Elsinoe australis]
MVANGLIFCLDQQSRTLKAFEGLADQSSVFPTKEHGSWSLDSEIQVDEWISVVCTTEEDKVRLKLNGTTVATLDGLDIHPLLGGAPNNSGSVAFGGPVGWTATYRNLHVQTLDGQALYSNTLLPSEAARTMLDFAVGSNPLSCTIDGAKRDRSTFGGDLFVMGQSVAYSTSNIDAIKGSIQLLTSHQTKDGFLGNLCPIQAPMHTEEEEPPTYAFYSLEYALLLVVAIKDYWFTSGDVHIVRKLWPKLIKLMDFVGSFESEQALIAAPPTLSLTFFPLAGPVFGPAAHINLAYYNALLAMTTMAEAAGADASTYVVVAETLKASILTELWSPKTGHLSIGASYPTASHSQQSHAYSILLGVSPPHASDAALLLQPDTSLPISFLSAPQFSHQPLVSPFSTAFAVEAAFKRSLGSGALSLLKRVWGPMADASNPDFSGCHWEAMNGEGRPIHDSTSLVHGWSTAPVYLLPKYLAGVRVVEPGWKRWAVEPVEAGVKHVEARLETVAGRLGARIDWDESGTKGRIKVEVPDGTVAEVIAPVGWLVIAGPSERSERKEAFTGPGTFVVSVRREAKTVTTPVFEAAELLEADADGRTLVAQT